MKVQANGLAIEVEDTGPVGPGAPVLLVMGLGMQLIAWPDPLVDALVQAGHRVVRFDNRDIGLSARFDHLGTPNLLWESMKMRVGLPVRAPYTLHDLAADALGVLDALGIAQAHVVGASMGGMIAQRMALAAPQRVLTLTSIMSSSGARHLPGPRPHVLQVLLSRPRDHSESVLLAHYVRLFEAIGSPGLSQLARGTAAAHPLVGAAGRLPTRGQRPPAGGGGGRHHAVAGTRSHRGAHAGAARHRRSPGARRLRRRHRTAHPGRALRRHPRHGP